MKRILKGLLFAFLIATASAPAMADENDAVSAKGTIRGRIIDNTKQTLPGATIYIENLHTGVTSDVNGFYTFTNLEPGTYRVKVTYVGYSPVEMTITIPQGKTIEKDVVMNEGLELQEVVVGGAFTGQRRALSSQKSNLGITNVVSADQVGKFPDSNIGDALKRISGINVQYDQGEARFGQVRGTSADMSSVTINGNRVPSAEGETRNVQLDLIPADMIQTIEVNKVVTPDMDADAIGGSINLVTKNSPYKRFISATAGTGYNFVADKMNMNFGFTYGDRFFNDKLGVMLSASYQKNPAGSDDVEMAYELNDDGEVVLDEYEVRQYYVTRERQSYSLALDWEINSNHKLDFKGIFNNRNDWENRYRRQYKWDDETPNEYEMVFESKAGGPDERYARLEQQRTMDFTLGGEHLFGRLQFDWKASYAQAGEKRPHERYLSFKREGVAMETDWTCDHGPYSEFGDLLTLRGAQFIGAGYGIPNIRGDGRTVATNHAWGAAFRGYGGPESEFPSEVLMDELAEKLGMDPFDLRELNCYKEGDTTPTGQKPEVMNLPTMFKALRPKYEAAKAKAKAESTDAVKRGVGLALAVYGAGLDGPDSSEAWAELNPDGSVTIGSSWEDHGQGADSGAQCTAHEALRPIGLPVEKIRLVMNDTSKTPNSGPAGGSRSQVMTGNAIRVACEQLVEAMRKPDGGFYTYDEMKAEGRAVHQDGKWTAPARDCGKNCQGEPFCCYMYGLFMAEVAVEVATGKTKVEKMTMVADIGKVVNRLLTDGQLYGGIAQGIGLALTEDYEDIKKHSTMAGAGIPTIKDIPDDLELIYVETPRPDGPFGASGTGEIPLCGPHPAIINAIYNACGARVTHLPAYPEKVLAAMPKK